MFFRLKQNTYVITLLYKASLFARAFNEEFNLVTMLGCKKCLAKPVSCLVQIMADPHLFDLLISNKKTLRHYKTPI